MSICRIENDFTTETRKSWKRWWLAGCVILRIVRWIWATMLRWLKASFKCKISSWRAHNCGSMLCGWFWRQRDAGYREEDNEEWRKLFDCPVALFVLLLLRFSQNCSQLSSSFPPFHKLWVYLEFQLSILFAFIPFNILSCSFNVKILSKPDYFGPERQVHSIVARQSFFPPVVLCFSARHENAAASLWWWVRKFGLFSSSELCGSEILFLLSCRAFKSERQWSESTNCAHCMPTTACLRLCVVGVALHAGSCMWSVLFIACRVPTTFWMIVCLSEFTDSPRSVFCHLSTTATLNLQSFNCTHVLSHDESLACNEFLVEKNVHTFFVWNHQSWMWTTTQSRATKWTCALFCAMGKMLLMHSLFSSILFSWNLSIHASNKFTLTLARSSLCRALELRIIWASWSWEKVDTMADFVMLRKKYTFHFVSNRDCTFCILFTPTTPKALGCVTGK